MMKNAAKNKNKEAEALGRRRSVKENQRMTKIKANNAAILKDIST